MSFFKRRFFVFVFIILTVAAGYRLARQSQMLSAFDQICSLVDEKFYLKDPRLDAWVSDCFQEAATTSFFISRHHFVNLIQDQMDEMGVSHFLIYNPVQDERLWKGQSLETGLRAKWIQGHLIVYKVLPSTPASRTGIQLGDEILAVNGHRSNAALDVSLKNGLYTLLRQGQKKFIHVAAAPIRIDSRPKLQRLTDSTALLDLSSFRSEYFDSEGWRELARQFKNYRHVIVDVRDNAGGNFVAMLRGLSPFFCEPTEIGDLVQPRKDLPDSEGFEDITDDDYQIDQLEKYRTIPLVTFDGYGCYRGFVTVLVNADTASVAEIFAQAFRLREHSRIWGQPSAGDVVLAVWYDVPSLGTGYSISIPEAMYQDEDGEDLEGHGVTLDRILGEDLSVWRKGADSDVHAALVTDY